MRLEGLAWSAGQGSGSCLRNKQASASGLTPKLNPTKKHMLQKLNSRRGGFTLVEIMIVVAIIALLATFAVPNFLRARQRTQATAVKQEALMLEQAKDQWAIENNKTIAQNPAWADLKPYVKDSTALYTNCNAASAFTDSMGGTFTVTGSNVKISTATEALFDTSVTGTNVSGFWAPYYQ